MSYFGDDLRDRQIPERNFMARFNDDDDDDIEAPPRRPPPPRGPASRGYEGEDPRNQGQYPPRQQQPMEQPMNNYPPGNDNFPQRGRGRGRGRYPRRGHGNYPPRGRGDYPPRGRGDFPPRMRGARGRGVYPPDRRSEPEPGLPYGSEEELQGYQPNGSRYVPQHPPFFEQTEAFERGPPNLDPDFEEQLNESLSGGATLVSDDTYQGIEEGEGFAAKISKTSIAVFCYVIVCLICLTQLIMGAIYLYRCPTNDNIPEWNMIIGGVTLVIIICIALLHGWERVRRNAEHPLKPFDDRGRSATSLGQFHKMSWLFLSIIQLLALVAGTIIIARRRPEFELERDDLNDDPFDDYDNRRLTGLSRFHDAEIMNPEFCDPGIWVFTLVIIIVGWVYLASLSLVWFYSFCYSPDIRVKEIRPTEVVYWEKQKSQQPAVNANIYS